MTMSDAKPSTETFLYQLSERVGLNWFKLITFVGSYQDSYAPFDSARIEISSKSRSKEDTQSRMVQNILRQLQIPKIIRVDVNFKISKKGLDSFIGRTAHIEFLENRTVIKMLVDRYVN